MSNQALADDLHAHRKPSEGVFPATAMHQAFRGSGFAQRGVLCLRDARENTVTGDVGKEWWFWKACRPKLQ